MTGQVSTWDAICHECSPRHSECSVSFEAYEVDHIDLMVCTGNATSTEIRDGWRTTQHLTYGEGWRLLNAGKAEDGGLSIATEGFPSNSLIRYAIKKLIFSLAEAASILYNRSIRIGK
jgi:hypothetical protein